MYKKNAMPITTISRHNVAEGETIEQKMDRIINNNEPLTDGAPLIYTDRNEGVLPQYDIRTDKMEIAMVETDKTARNQIARRKDLLDEMNKKQKGDETSKTDETPKSGDPSQ